MRSMSLSTFLQKKQEVGEFMASTKNISAMEKAQKMKLYLHVTVWKKMKVIGMDIPDFDSCKYAVSVMARK